MSCMVRCIFCLYAVCDVLILMFLIFKIKFLTNKPGVAMIQMSDKMASEMIIKNLNGLELFECKLVIA